MLELIVSDVHNIANRLKRINPKYHVFRNTAAGRVEVHTSTRPCALSLRAAGNWTPASNATLEFVVPFDELDERTLQHAQKTRIENFDVLEAEAASVNADIQTSAQRSAAHQSAALHDMMQYAGSQPHEVIFTKTKRWI